MIHQTVGLKCGLGLIKIVGIKKRRIHIFCFVFKTDLFLIDDFTPFKSHFHSIFFT